MTTPDVIVNIKNLAHSVLPANSSLFLYGSRARGDSHAGSDWDLLILLDKPSMEASDYGIAYPFVELGWELDEEINPTIYTKRQWDEWGFLPFKKNVEQDKIVLV